MRTGAYARAGEAASLVEELYNDASKMQGYRLDGLALTYALWPNHSSMITFTADRFLPPLRPVTASSRSGPATDCPRRSCSMPSPICTGSGWTSAPARSSTPRRR